MSYNTRNYTEQGGEKTVIGGELVIEPGGALVVKPGAAFSNENASEEENTGIPYMAGCAQSTGSNVAKDLSALIALLKAAGLMNTAAPAITVSAQPEDAACAVNGTITLSVTAASSDNRSLSYQWYSNTTDSNTGGAKITTNGTDRAYSPPTNESGTLYYYCVVSDGSGAATVSVAPVTTEAVTVVVG